MRLTSIELENFRCFEKEKIDLHPQLNVFVGLNASGKTALLEGVACGISRYLYILFRYTYLIEEKDIRRVGKDADLQSFTRIACRGNFGFQSLEYYWSRVLGKDRETSACRDFDQFVEKISSDVKGRQQIDLPVICYFSTRRIWGGIEDGSQINGFERQPIKFLGYYSCLSKLTNTYIFEKELEQMQLVVSQGKEFGFAYDSSRLDLIRSLAAKVIDGSKIFYYDYEKQSLAVIFNDGRRLAIDDLSDGQKSLLLISTGIAFQCATLNPHMGLDAYKSGGVVLIDEVELHLHPDWQRQILPILTREFPNIQFICTTHSPQVLSMLDRECVQVIEDFHVHPLERFVKGRDSNAILAEVFGIEKRPKEFSDQLQHFYTLLEAHEFEEAKEVLDRLEEVWGSMDAEIVRGWLFWADGQEVVIDDAAEVA